MSFKGGAGAGPRSEQSEASVERSEPQQRVRLCTHKAVHTQGARTRRCTHKAVHTQGGAHTRRCTHKAVYGHRRSLI